MLHIGLLIQQSNSVQYVQRAYQVDMLSEHIESSNYPVIVCGDFNDTPVSYTYRKLKSGLKDAFITAGTGLGTTYRGLVPYMRIDYIMHSGEFRAKHFQIRKVEWSDHYPVVTQFTISQTED